MRVPKRRLPVTLALSSGQLDDVEVFLSDYARTHAGPERLEDLLEEGERFLPVVHGGHIELIGRPSLRWVRVAPEHYGDGGFEDGGSQVAVRLTLDDGTALPGFMRFVAPTGRGRLQDYLNDAGAFVPLFTPSTVTLVRRACIARVELVEASA